VNQRRRPGWMVSVLVLLTGLVVGAAAVGAPAPRLIRLTFYYPVGVAGPLARVIDEMVGEFNKQTPDVEVVPVYSGDYDPTMQKVQTAVMGGNPPDIAIVEISEMPSLLAMDAIVELDAYVRGEGSGWLRDFFPAFLQNSYSDGKFYAVPFQRSTPVFYWNKDAFKDAGLDPDRPPATWEELEDYARKLVKRDAAGTVQRWGVTISGGWNDWLFEAFVRQNGGELLNYERRQLRFDTPEAVEALRFWVKLTNDLKVAPPHSTWASTPPDFVAGRTAMLYHSTGILTFLKNSARFPFGVAFMPRKKQYGAEVGGGNFYVFKRIPKAHQDAAWRFIRWMVTPERAAQWSMASGYIAVRRSAYDVPAMKEFVDKNPEYLVARDQLQYASGKIMAPNFQRLREILKRALDDATGGRVAPDAALRRAQQEAEAVLGAWLRRP
jgi:sn-glycerol 3-phosphate transport system substrate-binding protein